MTGLSSHHAALMGRLVRKGVLKPGTTFTAMSPFEHRLQTAIATGCPWSVLTHVEEVPACAA